MTPNSVTWDHPSSLLKACAGSWERSSQALTGLPDPRMPVVPLTPGGASNCRCRGSSRASPASPQQPGEEDSRKKKSSARVASEWSLPVPKHPVLVRANVDSSGSEPPELEMNLSDTTSAIPAEWVSYIPGCLPSICWHLGSHLWCVITLGWTHGLYRGAHKPRTNKQTKHPKTL